SNSVAIFGVDTLAPARGLGHIQPDLMKQYVFVGLHPVRIARQAIVDLMPIDVESRCLQSLALAGDRKSTRLNSSHVSISYAVFCLKKKKKTINKKRRAKEAQNTQ